MPFENPLLAKLFEGILEGRQVDFRKDLLPEDEVKKAIDLQPLPLSRRQRESVFRAWTHEVSYIQGPPGTGKSHTITAIMLAALFLKKSDETPHRVLLVSHKKPANGASVAVEVDGRDHFTEDGRSYSEAHLERVEVLRRAGWEIVHVPYYRWWRDAWSSDINDAQFQKTISDLFAELKYCLAIR